MTPVIIITHIFGIEIERRLQSHREQTQKSKRHRHVLVQRSLLHSLDKADGSGGSAEAIDIRQGNVVTYPIIAVYGATTFTQDVEFEEDVILTSPNGSRYKLLVSNSGNLSTQAI